VSVITNKRSDPNDLAGRRPMSPNLDNEPARLRLGGFLYRRHRPHRDRHISRSKVRIRRRLPPDAYVKPGAAQGWCWCEAARNQRWRLRFAPVNGHRQLGRLRPKSARPRHGGRFCAKEKPPGSGWSFSPLKETWKQLYQPLLTKRTSSRSEPMSLVNIELHRAVVTHLQ
jgi:hypothetical protein